MTEEIDDSLYRYPFLLGSNYFHVLKPPTMRAWRCGNAEIIPFQTKNLVLGGIEELTIQDNARCTVADMGVQFFIRQADVDSGKTR
ncbi:hypothetical protein X801_07768 [Opisthorchis viverrini]|uniref:Uncharacterized protein n=1 Tax=Opisthorchis viverrini TaxID=6198 RepID=A0A1S8WPV1_OPIVI|nr:hypothetical protein X801_07768 [Opisthorchis viverrini]